MISTALLTLRKYAGWKPASIRELLQLRRQFIFRANSCNLFSCQRVTHKHIFKCAPALSEQIRDMAPKTPRRNCGAIYQVLNRGDRREPIFQTDRDRALLSDAVAETCRKTARQRDAQKLNRREGETML